MGTTALRQLLKSLCSNSKWNYAVFWKLKLTSPMTLVWEDAYFECARLREYAEVMSDVHLNNMTNACCPYSEENMHDGTLSEYPLGLAPVDMSSHQYRWGEGFVGKVACTGNHCWVFSDDYIPGGFNFKSAPETSLQLPNEWHPQFKAGIKTILLAPVFPHGVLQLGSLERVAENVAAVAYIVDSFSSFQHAAGYCPSDLIKRDILVQSSPNVTYNTHEWAAGINSQYNDLQSENFEVIDGNETCGSNSSNSDPAIPFGTFRNTLQKTTEYLPPVLECSNENNSGLLQCCFTKVAPLDGCKTVVQSEMEGSHFDLSCLEEQSQPPCDHDNLNVGSFQEFSDGTLSSYFVDDMMKQDFRSGDVDAFCNAVSDVLNFPMGSALQEELQPSIQYQTDELICDAFESPSGNPHMDTCNDYFSSFSRESDEWLTEAGATGYLLEAVVANVHGSSYKRLCKRPDIVKPSSLHLHSSRLQRQCEASTSMGDDSGTQSYITSAAVAEKHNALPDSPSLTSFNSIISTLINKEQQRTQTSYRDCRSRANSKRTRVRDIPKPRPKDRQMFQDRLKELRQLVPSGTKLTIDGLLEQTIKHMLFLRSATDQAEKLRRWAHLKVADHSKSGSSGTRDNHQVADHSKSGSSGRRDHKNGTTWAVDVENENLLCPIVVKDLNLPGHLLIKVLCSDYSFFLEIAQLIRQSELTILKGVMEDHVNNTWAYFIVEAPEGIHRMDIFLPLLQILQHKASPISKYQV